MTKGLQDTPFGARVRAAYGGASDSEIQRKLDRKSPSDVGKWLKRGVWPPTEVLLQIARQTKTNLHWLVFGEGEGNLDPQRFLSETHRTIIQKIADDSKQTFEETLSGLVMSALLARGAAMFAQPDLEPNEIDQLRLMFRLYEPEEPEEEQKQRRVRPSATSRAS